MKRFVHTAAIQMEILPLQIEKNLTKARSLLEEALKYHTLDLVVFPEDCITGPIPANLDYALSNTDDAVTFFADLAKEYSVFVVCGSFITKEGDDYFNKSLLFDRDGKIILEYKKNNLWIPERRYLTKGSETPVVKTSIGTIGITICWDLAFPETFQQLAQKGADIICCPSYWTGEDSGSLHRKYPDISSEVNMVDALCPARAIENGSLVIYANGAKKAKVYLKTTTFEGNQIGHSQICAPLVGVAAKLNHNEEGYVYYEYDRHYGLDAEKNYMLRGDRSQAFNAVV